MPISRGRNKDDDGDDDGKVEDVDHINKKNLYSRKVLGGRGLGRNGLI